MICEKLFAYIIADWKGWIPALVLFIIGTIFELFEKGLRTGLIVIFGIIITFIMVLVFCDLVIYVFTRHKLGKDWFILLLVSAFYMLVLFAIKEYRVIESVLLFSIAFSLVFLICFKLRAMLTRE